MFCEFEPSDSRVVYGLGPPADKNGRSVGKSESFPRERRGKSSPKRDRSEEVAAERLSQAAHYLAHTQVEIANILEKSLAEFELLATRSRQLADYIRAIINDSNKDGAKRHETLNGSQGSEGGVRGPAQAGTPGSTGAQRTTKQPHGKRRRKKLIRPRKVGGGARSLETDEQSPPDDLVGDRPGEIVLAEEESAESRLKHLEVLLEEVDRVAAKIVELHTPGGFRKY